jgi:hypothetical protein
MFPWGFPSWTWDWGSGWGWAAAVGGIILLGIFLIPWFFFLLNLQNLLHRVSDQNRAMPAGNVWLNFIPVFNLGWFIYTVTKVRDSVRAEYQSRNWQPEGDFAYNVGLAAGVLAIVAFFMGWVPVLGWAVGIAEVVCWILYWLKTAELKNKLGERGAWAGTGQYPPPPYPGYPATQSPPAQGYPPAQPYPPTQPYPPATAPPEGTMSAGAPAEQPPSAAGAAEATPPPLVSGGETSADEVGGGEASGGGGQADLCAGCGSTYDAGDKFCRTCGLPLP